MLARLKSPVFIDYVVFELTDVVNSSLRAVLRDEQGSVCSKLETTVPNGQKSFRWNGLNDLPYGVYTLELDHGDEEQQKLRLVKRV
ncbi:MAG: hypothetical protein SFU87_15195 [Chitinophagaceae bacterium]|nr:hypothetical protein [Chitinophagaceae bacterium]